MNNWSSSIDSLLDKIHLNCIQLTYRHIKNHLYYKGTSAYFEIPTIMLIVFCGSFSVGSDDILSQEIISVMTCSVFMVITILTSIKLYMKITENSSQEQEFAISFKT
jgi:ammonia channel protein AmtB